jgi:RNA polymerase sigma factor (sigma-70 family)
MTAVALSPHQSLLPRLPSPLNFEAYARAVQALPFLDDARERELAMAWKTTQDKGAAWELVMAHLRLVVRVVRDQAGYGLSPGDLAQEGTVGLMKAVHRFDPDRGIRLAAYAIKWIEAEVREYIMRNWRLVRLGSGSAMKKLFFGYRQALTSLRRSIQARWPMHKPIFQVRMCHWKRRWGKTIIDKSGPICKPCRFKPPARMIRPGRLNGKIWRSTVMGR